MCALDHKCRDSFTAAKMCFCSSGVWKTCTLGRSHGLVSPDLPLGKCQPRWRAWPLSATHPTRRCGVWHYSPIIAFYSACSGKHKDSLKGRESTSRLCWPTGKWFLLNFCRKCDNADYIYANHIHFHYPGLQWTLCFETSFHYYYYDVCRFFKILFLLSSWARLWWWCKVYMNQLYYYFLLWGRRVLVLYVFMCMCKHSQAWDTSFAKDTF